MNAANGPTRRTVLGSAVGMSIASVLPYCSAFEAAAQESPDQLILPHQSFGKSTLPGIGTFHSLPLTLDKSLRSELTVKNRPSHVIPPEFVHADAMSHQIDGIPLYNNPESPRHVRRVNSLKGSLSWHVLRSTRPSCASGLSGW